MTVSQIIWVTSPTRWAAKRDDKQIEKMIPVIKKSALLSRAEALGYSTHGLSDCGTNRLNDHMLIVVSVSIVSLNNFVCPASVRNFNRQYFCLRHVQFHNASEAHNLQPSQCWNFGEGRQSIGNFRELDVLNSSECGCSTLQQHYPGSLLRNTVQEVERQNMPVQAQCHQWINKSKDESTNQRINSLTAKEQEIWRDSQESASTLGGCIQSWRTCKIPGNRSSTESVIQTLSLKAGIKNFSASFKLEMQIHYHGEVATALGKKRISEPYPNQPNELFEGYQSARCHHRTRKKCNGKANSKTSMIN